MDIYFFRNRDNATPLLCVSTCLTLLLGGLICMHEKKESKNISVRGVVALLQSECSRPVVRDIFAWNFIIKIGHAARAVEVRPPLSRVNLGQVWNAVTS